MLTTVQRAENYRTQTGRKTLTSRQARRILQKANRPGNVLTVKAVNVPAVAVQLSADVSGFVDAIESLIKRPCGGFDHCIAGSGSKARNTHKKCEAAA